MIKKLLVLGIISVLVFPGCKHEQMTSEIVPEPNTKRSDTIWADTVTLDLSGKTRRRKRRIRSRIEWMDKWGVYEVEILSPGRYDNKLVVRVSTRFSSSIPEAKEKVSEISELGRTWKW